MISIENRYYTPFIEEFRVGFEYEGKHNNVWEKIEQYDTDYEYELKEIEEGRTRVKYLDGADIEELGFVNMPDSNAFDKGDFQINFQDCNFLEVYDECSRIIFQGSIKNKSELKVLLKQLNIK